MGEENPKGRRGNNTSLSGGRQLVFSLSTTKTPSERYLFFVKLRNKRGRGKNVHSRTCSSELNICAPEPRVRGPRLDPVPVGFKIERSEIGVPAGKIYDFSRGVKRTCKDEQREDGIARRENERNFRDDACPPANGAERRSVNAHLNGTDSSHFPASVSVDVGNGSAAHRAAGAPRPKSAVSKKKRTKSGSILFAFGGD